MDELVCVRVHEDDVSRSAVFARRNRPDFDSDAFIVALERAGRKSKTVIYIVRAAKLWVEGSKVYPSQF